MIQIGKIRKGFHFIPDFVYPTIEEMFNNVENDLPKVLSGQEQFNLYFTVAHHLKGKRIKDSFQRQDVVAFDLDGIKLDRLDDYLEPVSTALGIPWQEMGVVYSGNGIHFYIKLKTPISDRAFFKQAKEGYTQLSNRINRHIQDAGLIGACDSTAWDSSRVLRVPFTKNVKEINGKEVVRNVVIKNKNMVAHDFSVPVIERKKEDKEFHMQGGSFPSPDVKTIIAECGFMNDVVNKPNEVHEPHMYAFFSILGHSVEGRKYAIDFANANFSSPSIDDCDKEQKMHQALTVSGPRTCAGVADLIGPSKCQECKHYNQIKSPIQIKGEDFIATADRGFTLKGPRGALKRQYHDLLTYFDKEYRHKTCGPIKKVYLWTGTHFRITNDLELKNYAHNKFYPLAATSETDEFNNLVKRSNYVGEEFLDSNTTGLINMKNGVLNIRTGELGQHDERHNFLYCLPYEYQPEATAPKFEKFLDDVTLGRECLKNILLEYMGYIISGSPYIYQKALILDGGGKNGKTTLLKVLKKLVGKENNANISLASLISNIFSSSGLHGKLLNISEEEPPQTFREKNGVFKNITGDGTVNAQYKYGDAFEFENKAKLVITYNEMPYLADTSQGMLRRLLIIPFDYDLENEHKDKVNPNIDADLESELSGIFNLCYEGYKRLAAQKGFTKSKFVDAKIDQILGHSDIVYSFLKDNCNVTRSPEDKIGLDRLYEAYENYHEGTAGDKPLTKRGFSRRIGRYGLVKQQVNQRAGDKVLTFKEVTGVKMNGHVAKARF